MKQDTRIQARGGPEPARDPHRSLHSETGTRPGEHPGRSGNPLVKVAGLAWLEFEQGPVARLLRCGGDLSPWPAGRAGKKR